MIDQLGALLLIGQGGSSKGGMSMQGMIVWFGIMLAIMYFILIRPQQRKEKERRLLLAAVKTGDRVLFAGGLIGSVTNVKEKIVTIKIAEKVKVEVAKGAVTQILQKGEQPDEDVNRS